MGSSRPVLIQDVKTWLGPDRADAGEREVEPARERFDLGAPFGRRGEQQLVVVAAGERRVARAGQVAGGGRERQRVGMQLGADPGDLEDVAEVGDQAVRDVDRRARDAAQRLAEREARPRQAIALDQIGARVARRPRARLAAPSGPARRRRACPRPRRRRPAWRRCRSSAAPVGHLADRGQRQGERPGRRRPCRRRAARCRTSHCRPRGRRRTRPASASLVSLARASASR